MTPSAPVAPPPSSDVIRQARDEVARIGSLALHEIDSEDFKLFYEAVAILLRSELLSLALRPDYAEMADSLASRVSEVRTNQALQTELAEVPLAVTSSTQSFSIFGEGDCFGRNICLGMKRFWK